jgi:uncharacterized protein YcnI
MRENMLRFGPVARLGSAQPAGRRATPARRAVRRVVTVSLAALAAVLVIAGPAAAHTEIAVDNATAGATNVTMSVNAEAESTKAGIASVAVQLPPGIAPNQVSLVSGPAGWSLSTTADGYQVAGAALKTGTSAEYKIKIAQLPAAAGVLTFKTVVTYANGDADSWIGAPGSDNPAPTVTLAAGTAAPSPTATSAAPTSPPAAAFSTPAPTAKSDNGGGGWPSWATWLIVVGVIAAAVITVLVLRNRRATPPQA